MESKCFSSTAPRLLTEATRADADFHETEEQLELALQAAREGELELLRCREELRRLATAAAVAEERVRRRIALGLHDSVGQTLAIAKINLGKLTHSEVSPEVHQLASEIRELVDQAIRETRALTFALSSPLIHELGLEAAIRGLCQELGERCDTKFQLEMDEHPKPLSDDRSFAVFRATRELLMNVFKHAHARSALVSVARVADRIRISVRDDGVGFDSSHAGRSLSPDGNFGLFSVREGLAQIGGTLEIESTPGAGAWGELTAPLEEREA